MRARHFWSLAGLLIGLGLLSACASTDMGITGKVKAQFVADDLVQSAQIEVATKDGVVTLTGNADSEEAKQRALRLARDTTGVVEVVDMISARTASGDGNAPDADRTIGEVFDDSAITIRVKSRLLDDALVDGLEIDVDTRNGVVFLTGKVASDKQRETAIRLARETKGVRDVQANLTLDQG